MKIREIAELLNAQKLCGEYCPTLDIKCACGSDMMSDVLAFTKYDAILLTGLINNHVIRTAEMLDIQVIMFVRGKIPPQEVIEMAEEQGMILMTTDLTMFTACGMLYEKGIIGGKRGD